MGTIETTFMSATLCAILINSLQAIFGGKSSSSKNVSPTDFIPQWGKIDELKKEQSVEDMKRMLQQIALTSKKNVKTKKRVPKVKGRVL